MFDAGSPVMRMDQVQIDSDVQSDVAKLRGCAAFALVVVLGILAGALLVPVRHDDESAEQHQRPQVSVVPTSREERAVLLDHGGRAIDLRPSSVPDATPVQDSAPASIVHEAPPADVAADAAVVAADRSRVAPASVAAAAKVAAAPTRRRHHRVLRHHRPTGGRCDAMCRAFKATAHAAGLI